MFKCSCESWYVFSTCDNRFSCLRTKLAWGSFFTRRILSLGGGMAISIVYQCDWLSGCANRAARYSNATLNKRDGLHRPERLFNMNFENCWMFFFFFKMSLRVVSFNVFVWARLLFTLLLTLTMAEKTRIVVSLSGVAVSCCCVGQVTHPNQLILGYIGDWHATPDWQNPPPSMTKSSLYQKLTRAAGRKVTFAH